VVHENGFDICSGRDDDFSSERKISIEPGRPNSSSVYKKESAHARPGQCSGTLALLTSFNSDLSISQLLSFTDWLNNETRRVGVL
jgi:hypothetical protein